jgi:hypothetical protein
MNKTMFAAVFASVVLMFGTVALVLEMAPDAEAVKARGTYLKDTTSNQRHSSSKVCGDQLCGALIDTSTGLKKGQISRGFAR